MNSVWILAKEICDEDFGLDGFDIIEVFDDRRFC